MRRFRSPLVVGLALLAGALATHLINQRPVSAQGPAGPPGGLAVNVVGGSIDVGGTVAATQSGDWTVNVKNAGTPLFLSAAPTCDVGNRCFVTSAAVPAGKILTVTHLHGTVRTQGEGTVGFHIDDTDDPPLFLLPSPKFGAAFRGTVVSFNIDTELIVGAGHKAVVEVSVPAGVGGIPADARNLLGLTGVLADAPQ